MPHFPTEGQGPAETSPCPDGKPHRHCDYEDGGEGGFLETNLPGWAMAGLAAGGIVGRGEIQCVFTSFRNIDGPPQPAAALIFETFAIRRETGWREPDGRSPGRRQVSAWRAAGVAPRHKRRRRLEQTRDDV